MRGAVSDRRIIFFINEPLSFFNISDRVAAIQCCYKRHKRWNILASLPQKNIMYSMVLTVTTFYREMGATTRNMKWTIAECFQLTLCVHHYFVNKISVFSLYIHLFNYFCQKDSPKCYFRAVNTKNAAILSVLYMQLYSSQKDRN